MTENNRNKYLFLTLMTIIPLAFSIALFQDVESLRNDFLLLVTEPTFLNFDAFSCVDGLSAPFLNAFLSSLIVVLIFRLFNVELTGTHLAAYFQVYGFSFYGKNIVSIMIITTLTVIILKGMKKDIGAHVPFMIFVTALTPILNADIFAIKNQYVFLNMAINSVLIAIIISITLIIIEHEFILEDHNFVYKTGYFLGLATSLCFSVIFIVGIRQGQTMIIQDSIYVSHILKIYSRLICLVLLLSMILFNDKSYCNMFFVAVIGVVFILAINQPFNGPVVAALLTAVGFSYDQIKVTDYLKIIFMYCVLIITLKYIFNVRFDLLTITLMGLFISGYAPAFENYNLLRVALMLVLHILIAPKISLLHGKALLYNNGFTCGVVSGLIVPVIVKTLDKIKNRFDLFKKIG